MTEQNTPVVTGNAGQAAPEVSATPTPPAAPPVDDIIVGNELEAALAERAAKREGAPRRVFPYGGDKFEMRPVLPASVGLSAARMQETGEAIHILRAIKQFFVPGEGDRFVDAITNPDAEVAPDDEFWGELLQTLIEAYGQRPLGNA